ncbi:MAG: hypothetical protein QOD06_2308 [Candidatus Binatota bacterium]|nr:hypothetical protein [Candidatus Binatota bacterium]
MACDLGLGTEEEVIDSGKAYELVRLRDRLEGSFERIHRTVGIAIAGDEELRLLRRTEERQVEPADGRRDRDQSLHASVVGAGRERDHGAEGVPAERELRDAAALAQERDRRARIVTLPFALVVLAFASARPAKVEAQVATPASWRAVAAPVINGTSIVPP